MLNVANAAQTVIVANAATTAFFGTDLQSFLLNGWARPHTSATDNSYELSMAEIVKGFIPGGDGFGFYSKANPPWTIGRVIGYNLKTPRGGQALATMVFAPIAFKVGKRVLQKPLLNPVNKGLKQLGLASVVKV